MPLRKPLSNVEEIVKAVREHSWKKLAYSDDPPASHSGHPSLSIGGTEVIDSSRNLKNILNSGLSDSEFCILPTASRYQVLMRNSVDWKAEKIANIPNDILEAMFKHTSPFFFCCHWLPSGLFLTALGGTGSINWFAYDVQLNTGTTSGSYACVYKQVFGLSQSRIWDAPRRFAVLIFPWQSTSQIIHIVTGGISSYTAIANTARHLGFKIENANLYGTVGNNTNESTVLLGTISALSYVWLMVEYVNAVSAKFYVNGAYVDQVTTNLPSGEPDSEDMFRVSISNTVASARNIGLYEARTVQYLT